MDTVHLEDYPRLLSGQHIPSRQPTLESQRDMVAKSRNVWARVSHRPRILDDFEHIIDQQTRVQHSEELVDFLSYYRRLKLRRGANILQCLVWYKAFAPTIPRPTATWFEPEPLHFDDDCSFSLGVHQLTDALKADPRDHLQLCAIAAEPDEKILSQTFSFSQKLFVSLRLHLDRLNDAPRRSITTLLAHEWSLSADIKSLLTRERSLERTIWKLKLPSLKGSLQVPLDLLNPNGQTLALTWQYLPPRYKGDFDIYTWLQYQEPPSFQYADIFLLSPRRMIISFKSSQMLRRFTSLRLSQTILGPPSKSCQPWSTVSELLLSVLIVYQQMIEETGVFIRESMYEMNAMKKLGRRGPSATKVRYLVHLSDCRLSAEQGITHGLSSLSGLSAAISSLQNAQPVWDAGISFADRLETIKKDLIYLNRELKLTKHKIEELQTMLHDHLSLTQTERVFILTIVAAFYVPLSFLASFFGMNITEATPKDFSGLSQLANDSLADLPRSAYNQTASVLTTLSSSGSRTWDLKYYWILATPSLLSIPLFLVSGGILRWTIQSAAKYAVYWRIATFVVAPIVYGGFYWCLPYFGGDSGFITYVGLNYGGFGIFAFWKLHVAFRIRKGRRVWICFLLLLVVGFLLDSLLYGGLSFIVQPLYMLVPWAFICWRWIVSEHSS